MYKELMDAADLEIESFYAYKELYYGTTSESHCKMYSAMAKDAVDHFKHLHDIFREHTGEMLSNLERGYKAHMECEYTKMVNYLSMMK